MGIEQKKRLICLKRRLIPKAINPINGVTTPRALNTSMVLLLVAHHMFVVSTCEQQALDVAIRSMYAMGYALHMLQFTEYSLTAFVFLADLADEPLTAAATAALIASWRLFSSTSFWFSSNLSKSLSLLSLSFNACCGSALVRYFCKMACVWMRENPKCNWCN